MKITITTIQVLVLSMMNSKNTNPQHSKDITLQLPLQEKRQILEILIACTCRNKIIFQFPKVNLLIDLGTLQNQVLIQGLEALLGNIKKLLYKDLLNMIKEKDKLIGKLQSENEGKEFVELNSIQEKSVVEFTKKHLFPYCQFIRNADVLDRFESSNSIGNMIMNCIGVKDNIRSNFWFTYKHIVRKAIKQQRNISHNAIRNVFISE